MNDRNNLDTRVNAIRFPKSQNVLDKEKKVKELEEVRKDDSKQRRLSLLKRISERIVALFV